MTRQTATSFTVISLSLIAAVTVFAIVASFLSNDRVSDFSLKGGSMLVEATLACKGN